MHRAFPSRRFLAAGLGLSAAVHAGIGIVARVTPVAGGPPRATDAAPVEMALLIEPAEAERVTLGIEASEEQTRAWLGFEDQTEHQAPQSEVEQAAMTPTRVGAATSAGAPAPEPSAEPSAEPVEATPATTLPTASPPDLLLEALSPAEPPASESSTVDPAELLAPPAALLAAAPPAEPAPVADAPHQPSLEPVSADSAAERSAPEDASPAPDPGEQPTLAGEGGERAGEQSPSESDPTALLRPVEVRPGRVAAAQGLRITTVRPVFDPATVVLAHPRSPTVVIEFGKDGQVRRARFLPGRSTGDRNVDQPLLYAIYRWTAAGEALERLTDDPDDTVSITMRIILR